VTVLFSRLKAISGGLTVFLTVSLLAGCASTPEWPSPKDDQLSRPDRVTLDDVPFYPQERYQCGPASLAMMLNSQGLHTDPDILKELVYIPGREGSLQVEMVAAARAHGMLVYPLDGELESLLVEIDSGNPVLVMQNLRFDWWPQWHFAVVMGYDSEERDLILHTDTRKREAIDLEVFSNTWGRADNWAARMRQGAISCARQHVFRSSPRAGTTLLSHCRKAAVRGQQSRLHGVLRLWHRIVLVSRNC
jgi:hypothetical protein